MNESQDRSLDEQLREALGSPGTADFQAWRKRHGDSIAYLNPVVTELFRRRRRLLVRVTSATVAAATVLVIFSFAFQPQQTSFAQVVGAINKAATVTWTSTTYTRFYSQDGERTWLRAEPRSEIAYRAPNFYRDTRYDKEGNVRSVEIVDTISKKTLYLDMKSKKATWKVEPINQYGPGKPFDWIARILRTRPLQLVGQREVNGANVNVFRYQLEKPTFLGGSRDIWINAETKELVGWTEPGADYFDPETAPDRDNPAEKTFSRGTLVGGIRSDIVFDAELDPDLFNLKPPPGFEVVVEPPRPTVTESEMIEWLGATARFNGDRFFDTHEGFENERFNEADRKDKADRTKIEQELIDLQYKHMLNHNGQPILDFVDEYAVRGSFRYLGKGVRLGSTDRIVLFYKLKSTGEYRAIFGDLTVKDVIPDELPLPVEQ